MLLAVLSLFFHWQSRAEPLGARPAGSIQSQPRILAYVVASAAQRSALEDSLDRWAAELEDRDMLLVNLGDIELETNYAMDLGAEERDLWRKLWEIDLSESCFVLVGKDGGAKAFQRGGLDLRQFFDLIDAMPMRRAELRARGGGSHLR